MAPKDRKQQGKRNSSVVNDIELALQVEPHLRSIEQWKATGKESLTLTSNMNNMNVKGVSVHDMATALFQLYHQDSSALHNNISESEVEEDSNVGDELAGDVVAGGSGLKAAAVLSKHNSSTPKKNGGKVIKKRRKQPLFDVNEFKTDIQNFIRTELNTATQNLKNVKSRSLPTSSEALLNPPFPMFSRSPFSVPG